MNLHLEELGHARAAAENQQRLGPRSATSIAANPLLENLVWENGRSNLKSASRPSRGERLRRGRLVYPRIVTANATAVSTTAPGRCVQSR